MCESKLIRVHFQSNPRAPLVFQMTPERYEQAARRYPDVGPRVDATIGTDWPSFYSAMQEAEVLVGWGFPRHEIREKAPKLRWIHIWGAGIEHLLPLDWLPRRIALTNNSGVHVPKVAEYVTMSLLMLNSRVPTFVSQQSQAKWNEIFSSRIAGKTLAVIGVGHMGGTAARQAKKLGMHVLGVRRTKRRHRYVDEMFGTDDLHRVLSRSDFVIVTTPFTSETRHLIGREALDAMKPGAGFINLGRAQVVDYEALTEKLAQGYLSGAVLDVFDPEPLPSDSPLWTTPNLVITPHVASDDELEYMPRTLDLVFDNLRRLLAGRPLKNRVRRHLQY
jgi:phosphoglycerate dehydrogenase-like enzyme